MRKSIEEYYPILGMKIDSRILIAFYPLLIVLGKIVRWTIMRGSLVNFSAGWAWVDPIMHNGWSWQFFGVEELTEGDIGLGDNVLTFFKAFWATIWAQLPETFQEFEIFITVTFGILFLLVLLGIRRRLPLLEAVFICLSVIVTSVYCLSLSKEPFQMIFFLLMYAMLHSGHIPERQKLYWGYSIILLSAACFRTYYALILFFSLICRWYLNRTKTYNASQRPYRGQLRWLSILLVYFIAVASYFVLITFFSLTNTELYERFRDTLLYASNATSGSNTYMKNIFAVNETNPNVFSVTAEYALAILRLLFPFELIGKGPKYWPYILYQLCMTFFMIKGLRNFRCNTKTQNAALTIFVGYVFASAAFEVDYGAWVRHCAVTVPIVLIMAGICPVKRTMPVSQNSDNESWHQEKLSVVN